MKLVAPRLGEEAQAGATKGAQPVLPHPLANWGAPGTGLPHGTPRRLLPSPQERVFLMPSLLPSFFFFFFLNTHNIYIF